MRVIPEDNLAYPVLIKLNTGQSGSGFLMEDGTRIFIISAKHVFFKSDGSLIGATAEVICQTKDIKDDSTTVYSIDLEKLLVQNKLFKHAISDVAALEIAIKQPNPDGKTFGILHNEGIFNVNVGNSHIVIAQYASVLLIDDVLVGNDVFIYGYPSSLGIKSSPQFDYEKPLLRKGIVANVNKRQGNIILDCPVYYGNSGGPVVQASFKNFGWHHNIIGVIIEFIPYSENWINQSNNINHIEISNSGYSVAASMNHVFDMLGIKK